MDSKHYRGIALSAAAFLLVGLTACASSSESTQQTAPIQEAQEEPAAETPQEAELDWPEEITLPRPEGMSVRNVEFRYGCDGRAWSATIWSEDATTEEASACVEQVRKYLDVEFEFNPNSGMFSAPHTAEMNVDTPKSMQYERFDGKDVGYVSTLIESEATPYLPQEAWMDFPRPDGVEFKSCEMRSSTSYTESRGFTPLAYTWTAFTEYGDTQPFRSWLKGLRSEGWDINDYTKTETPSAQVGDPSVSVESAEYRAVYSTESTGLKLIVSTQGS